MSLLGKESPAWEPPSTILLDFMVRSPACEVTAVRLLLLEVLQPQFSLHVLGVYVAGHRRAGGCLGHMCNFCDSDPRASSRVCLSRHVHPNCEQRGARGSPRSSPCAALAAGQGPAAERLVRGLEVAREVWMVRVPAGAVGAVQPEAPGPRAWSGGGAACVPAPMAPLRCLYPCTVSFLR